MHPTPFSAIDFSGTRLFDTGDVDEARALCGRIFNPHRLAVLGRGQRLQARMDHRRLGPLGLSRLTWGAAVAVDPDQLGRYDLLSLPLAGHARFHLGGRLLRVHPGCAALVNAGQRFHVDTSADFAQWVLRIERSAVDAAWAARQGRPAGDTPCRPPGGAAIGDPGHAATAAPAATPTDAPICFEPLLPLDGAGWAALQPGLQLLARSAAAGLPEAAQRHLQARAEALVLDALLQHQAPQPAGAGHLAGRPASPGVPSGATAALVRRGQALLAAQLEEPWTLAAAARATGVATRTLQAAFHARCGMGPMQWLREQRLQAVRAVLAAPGGVPGAAAAGMAGGVTGAASGGGAGGATDLRAGRATGPAAAGPATPSVTDTALRFGFSHLGEFARAYRARFGESPSQTRARRG